HKKLAALIGTKAGQSVGVSAKLSTELERKVEDLAVRLWDARGKGLVVCGVNNIHCQLLVNAINEMLGNYGQTVDLEKPSYQYAGNDTELMSLMDEIKSRRVAVLFIAGTNPVYDLPDGTKLGDPLKKIPLVVSFSERLDETSECAKYVCPPPHALEAWTDLEPVAGVVAVAQPTIQPLMNTRHLIESLSTWMGMKQSAHDLIQAEWERAVFSEWSPTDKRQSKEATFSKFWTKTLEDGYAEVAASTSKAQFNYSSFASALNDSADKIGESEYTLVLYPSMSVLDGRHAHNPWLQEMPDPVSKVVWDNYASLSKTTAQKLDVEHGGILHIKIQDQTLELPAYIQPGQHDSVVAVALGYGRKGTDRFTNIGPDWIQARLTVEPGELIGKNAAPFIQMTGGSLSYSGQGVTLSNTGNSRSLVVTQEYNSLHEPNLLGKPAHERRPIVQETTLAAYAADPSSGSFHREKLDSMWPDDHKYTGHHWGMVVDLTACTGCTACVISCQAENNVPVVGKDEVRRNREMAWIRVDRYYDEADGGFSVSHQPMMCQHCGNAPCETVCPVLATVHNDEGLNQQVYNRCVGTRYCANNCPYKMRRFNWFQYRHGDEMHKMVLNPDVTVRDRGVMEKCSFCIQRIQLAKIEAKMDGQPLKDGDAMPACAQSCPAEAIVFGDMNDPN
ncbi:MAG: 4Fe-4S dicluster domain-containing protein, partial [Bacteroidota bacterium]